LSGASAYKPNMKSKGSGVGGWATLVVLAWLAVLALVALTGCPQSPSGSCADNGTCQPQPDAGSDAVADVTVGMGGDGAADTSIEADAPPAVEEENPAEDAAIDAADAADVMTCDPTMPPSAEPCVISEAYGVFVSPMGSPTGAGTRMSPLSTIDAAITLAKSSGDAGAPKRVYVCGGTYDEHITVDATRDGAQIYGGLQCSDWSYTDEATTLAPTNAGVALTLTDVTHVAITDLAIKAMAAPSAAPTTPGQAGASSLAMFVSGSTGVMLERCTLTAGAGQPGLDAMAVAAFTSSAPNGSPGTANANGGQSPNPTCTTSVGGAGGAPAPSGQDGIDGQPDPSDMPNNGKASAGACTVPDQLAQGSGVNGTPGAGGAQGAGAASWGVLSSMAWIPNGGAAGGNGGIGRGGGGGASFTSPGGGGGGAAGGCGGAAGSGGTGGGSSIALLAYQSSIDLEQCLLNATDAGGGGNGAAGQAGQAGGNYGAGSAPACPGGNGGAGGGGGGGGGGAGGISAGIAWSGSGTQLTVDGATVTAAPTLSAVTTLGTPGASGMHGGGGGGTNAGAPGTDGKAGVAQAVVPL
jgi:hypothetical protein